MSALLIFLTDFPFQDTLPALVDEQGTCISGFRDIAKHLSENRLSNIDDDLTPLQTADAAACTAYLSMRGSALLALALYVSHSAWVSLTRPAYSQLLPFPLTWTIPPAIRSAAVERVEHLGLGHLAASVDDLDDSSLSTGSGAATTATGFLQLPARFGPSKTLQPEQTAAIRLQNMADDFFSVIRDYRNAQSGAEGNKPAEADSNLFLFGRDAPSSTDFLAYAYLKLMRVQTPQPFLRKAMLKSYPDLWSFSDPAHLPPPHTPQDNSDDNLTSSLPWHKDHPTRGVLPTIGKFADTAIGHIPSVGPSWTRFRQSNELSSGNNTLQAALTLGLAGTAAVAAGALVLFVKNLAPLGAPVHIFDADTYPPAASQKDHTRNGEAQGGHGFSSSSRNHLGSMLSHLPDFGPTGRVSTPSSAAAAVRRDKVYDDGAVEVDVDVEPGPSLSGAPADSVRGPLVKS